MAGDTSSIGDWGTAMGRTAQDYPSETMRLIAMFAPPQYRPAASLIAGGTELSLQGRREQAYLDALQAKETGVKMTDAQREASRQLLARGPGRSPGQIMGSTALEARIAQDAARAERERRQAQMRQQSRAAGFVPTSIPARVPARQASLVRPPQRSRSEELEEMAKLLTRRPGYLQDYAASQRPMRFEVG